MSIKSGMYVFVNEDVRPPGVRWSSTSGTLQHCLCHIYQTVLRDIWQCLHTHTHIPRGKEEEREYRPEALEKEKTWLRKVSRDLSYLILSLHLSLSFIPNPKLALFQFHHHLSVVSTRLPTSYVFSLTRSSKRTSSLSTTFFTRWYLFCNSEMSVCLVFAFQGKPAPAAKRVAPLCQVGQADSSSVSGPTRAASSGRQCQLASRLLRDHAGDEWARQEKDPWQVAALH